MPKRAPRPCAVHGCPNLVDEGSRCQQHQLSRRRERETRRPSAARRGYGSKWKEKRDAYIAVHPWCADPYGVHQGEPVKAKIVDHIVPRKQGGRDDESNYQALCVRCNNYKTAHDGSRKSRRGRGG